MAKKNGTIEVTKDLGIIFRTLNRVGITDEELVQALKLDAKLIEKAIELKLIKKCTEMNKETRSPVTFYRIDKKGLRFQNNVLKKHAETKHMYKDSRMTIAGKQLSSNRHYGYQSYEHDIKIARYYTYNLTQKEKDSFINETELREMFIDRFPNRKQELNHSISTTDFAYTKEGISEVSLVESITSNYSENELQMKENFGEALGASVEYI